MPEQDEALARRLQVLREVASIPTAPLHETRVSSYVTRFLVRLGLRPQRDRWGNLIVIYSRGSTSQTPLALVAHMDHPAFELVSADGGAATALLLGGVAAACFRKPTPVRVFPSAGSAEVRGEIVGYEEPEPRRVLLRLALAGPAAPGDFGVFDLPDFRQEGDVVHLRAADDLAGCAIILLTLEELARRQVEASVHGVFTRAEEVGLVGATLLAEDGALPRDAVVVSLETSKELPGAVMGQGPVIRVGDRTRSFDPDAEAVLLAARSRLQERDAASAVQRQLMSGGTCEATAFGLKGYRTTGVALPLGNYHNVGPDDTIAAEYVSARDCSTAVDLLVVAAEVVGRPTEHLWSRFAEATTRYRDRLAATASELGPAQPAYPVRPADPSPPSLF